MSASWIAGLAATAATLGILTGLITLTEKGHAYWRKLVNDVGFWRNLKRRNEALEKRVAELEAPPMPRNWDQQHCSICRKRGHPVDGHGSFRDGHWTVWFMCDDCKPVWPVRMD